MEGKPRIVVKLPITDLSHAIIATDTEVWQEIEQTYMEVDDHYNYTHEDTNTNQDYELDLTQIVLEAEIIFSGDENKEYKMFEGLHSDEMMNILCLEANDCWQIYYVMLLNLKPFMDKNGIQEVVVSCPKMDLVVLTGSLRGHKLSVINYLDDNDTVKLQIDEDVYDVKVDGDKKELLDIFDKYDISPDVLPKGKTVGDMLDNTDKDMLSKFDDIVIKEN